MWIPSSSSSRQTLNASTLRSSVEGANNNTAAPSIKPANNNNTVTIILLLNYLNRILSWQSMRPGE
jgi:hypothetical protein